VKIVNIEVFGNFKPGDQVELPDNATFDSFYFKPVKVADNAPVTPVTTEGGVK
jgi:hypothetical protein